MVVAIQEWSAHQKPMLHLRIAELEQQLLAANGALAALTLANTALTTELAEAEGRARKLKRNSRNNESALKDQLTAAQSRRG